MEELKEAKEWEELEGAEVAEGIWVRQNENKKMNRLEFDEEKIRLLRDVKS